MSAKQPIRPASVPREGDAADIDRMRRLRLGDTTAFEALMREYWAPLVRYVARMTGSTDGAEDIVQDAFATLWTQRADWKPIGSPRSWLYSIARNRALKELRHSSVRQKWASLIRWQARPVQTPFDAARREELRQAFERALAKLPSRRREAFVLSRYHGLSLDEIAAIMGLASQTVSNHVSAAAADLRALLKDFSD